MFIRNGTSDFTTAQVISPPHWLKKNQRIGLPYVQTAPILRYCIPNVMKMVPSWKTITRYDRRNQKNIGVQTISNKHGVTHWIRQKWVQGFISIRGGFEHGVPQNLSVKSSFFQLNHMERETARIMGIRWDSIRSPTWEWSFGHERWELGTCQNLLHPITSDIIILQ